MQNEVIRQNAASMSERQLLVRDIIANLLLAEPSKIDAYSDFFLLGGNSLLLGKLAYHIRKEMGVNVGVAALFHQQFDQRYRIARRGRGEARIQTNVG